MVPPAVWSGLWQHRPMLANSLLRGTAVAMLAACAAPAAPAADRPYLYVNTAHGEEDEEQVWAVENWFRRAGGERSLTVAPEYAFDPQNALQMEFRRVLRREGTGGHELELEYKHLFNSFARDGWGWGLVVTADLERAEGESMKRRATTVLLPFTFQLGEAASEGLLHVNAGIAKPTGERRLFTGALGLEREVWRRTTLFGELARDDEGRFAQLGLRHWITREKLAVDIAWQRVRNDELRGSGVVLGIAWYDL